MDAFFAVVTGRQQGSGIARCHEGRHRLGAAPQTRGLVDRVKAFGALVPGDGRGVGNGEQAASFRQRYQFNRFGQHRFWPAHTGHGQVRVVVDLALSIGVDQARQILLHRVVS